MASLNEETTRLLLDLCQGNQHAADRLLPVIYDELRRVAGWYMSGERTGHTLEPTALVHEAFLRLRKLEHIEWNNRAHFCAVAAHIMRRILVDHARRRGAEKRGQGFTQVHLDDRLSAVVGGQDIDLLDLEEALDRLAELNPRHAQVVEMRFFAGLSVEETAAILDVSPSTVKNDWRMARAWLLMQMDK